MLNAFESRIVELLSDRLSEVAELEAVLRPHDGVAAPAADKVQLQIRLLDAAPRASVGDDARARLGEPGAWRRRLTLQLAGTVELRLRVGKANNAGQRAAQRGRLIGVLDRLLLTLADEALRAGTAFATDTDQGFELDGFRLEAVRAPTADKPDDVAGLEAEIRDFTVLVAYAGRFWPVGEEQAGISIAALPIRTAVLPAGLPRDAWVRAGELLELPIRVALGGMVLGEGDPPLPAQQIMARLRGSSGGTLLGDPIPAAPGWIGYAPLADQPDTIVVRYQAPDAVAGKAEARIALAFDRPTGGRVGLGELTVEVRE